jgi:hypothetical protein
MASTITADNGVSSGSAGLKTAADSTGVLALRTTTAGGTATTAATISTSQVVNFVNTPTVNGTPLAVGSSGFTGATAVTSATDVTLTSASTQIQLVSMTAAGQYVVLPSATTMTKGAIGFLIQNMGAYAFGVKDGAGNIIFPSVNPYQNANFSATDNSTIGGKWTLVSTGPSNTIPLSFGSTNLSATTVYAGILDCCALTSTTSLIVYQTGANAASAVIATTSGNTVTLGTPVSLWSATYGYVLKVVGLSATSAVVFTNSGNVIYGKAISISGSTITSGTTTSSGVTAYDVVYASYIVDSSTTGLLATATSVTNIQSVAFSVSGTTITFGTSVSSITLAAGATVIGCAVAKSAANTYVLVGANDASGGSGDIKHRGLSLSGTTITLGTTTTQEPNSSSYIRSTFQNQGYIADGMTGPSGWVSFPTVYGPYSLQYSGTTYVASSSSFSGTGSANTNGRFTTIGTLGAYISPPYSGAVNTAPVYITFPGAGVAYTFGQNMPNANVVNAVSTPNTTGIAQLATNTALVVFSGQSGASYYLATQVVTLNY